MRLNALSRFKMWVSSPVHLILTGLALVPPALILIYMQTYVVNVPLLDTWQYLVPIASKVQHGTFTIGDAFTPRFGHQFFITQMVTAVSTYLFGWNIATGTYLNFALSLANFVIVCSLVYRQEAGALAITLIPLSGLVFTLRLVLGWLINVWTVSLFPLTFFLLAVWVLCVQPLTWWRVSLAAFLALCSTFSHGSGLLSWPALLFTLWALGVRSRKMYAFWVAASIAGVGLWLASSGIDVATGSGGIVVSYSTAGGAMDQTISSLNPLLMLRGALAFLANPIVMNPANANLALLIGIVLVILLTVNLYFLWSRDRDLTQVAPWAALAIYAVGTGVLISLKHDTTTRLGLSIQMWYVQESTLLWIALAAAMSIAAYRIVEASHRTNSRAKLLLAGNVLAVAIFLPFYVQNSFQVLHKTTQVYGHGLGLGYRSAAENCYFESLFTRDADICPPQSDEIARQFNVWFAYGYTLVPDQVAADRLGMFAHWPTTSILPESYQSGTLVVVETPLLWINIHVADWLLDTVPRDDILHIAPKYGQEVDSVYYPDNLIFGDDIGIDETVTSPFHAMISDGDEFWAVSVFGEGKWGTGSLVSSFNRPYRVESFTVGGYQALGGSLEVAHFRPSPQEPARSDDPYYFGDSMRLEAWSMLDSAPPQPCQPITVETTWTSTGATEHNYSMTLVIADADGIGLVSADEPPTGIETLFWQPQWTYVDRRSVTMPCAAGPGEYLLLVGVYDIDTTGNLPVSLYDGTPVGDLLYLTTLTIGDSQ